MKTTRHSLMAKGIMVLLSLLVIVFAFTYSWFREPEITVSASGLTVSSRSGTDFEYAIGFKNSQTFGEYLVTDFTSISSNQLDIEHLTVNDGMHEDDQGNLIQYNLLYDYVPTDVTGDGVNLIRPNMEYGNWSINEGTEDYSVADPNTQYISFDIIIKSRSFGVLSIGPNSFAIGNVESFPGDGKLVDSDSENYNASTYGDFSRDAIVGAVRVAFIDFVQLSDTNVETLLSSDMSELLEDTPSLLWVPRPDIYLNNNPTGTDNRDQEVTGWSLNTGVQPDDDPFNLVSQAMIDSSYTTYRHQQYDIFNNHNRNVVTNSNSYVYISSKDADDDYYHLNDTVPVTALSYSEDVVEDGADITYYYGKVRVRAWIEGTDSESRRALSGGKFKLSFDLSTN